jgi:hypothetical protein
MQSIINNKILLQWFTRKTYQEKTVSEITYTFSLPGTYAKNTDIYREILTNFF